MAKGWKTMKAKQPMIKTRRVSLIQLADALQADAHFTWEGMLEELERTNEQAYTKLTIRFGSKNNCADILKMMAKTDVFGSLTKRELFRSLGAFGVMKFKRSGVVHEAGEAGSCLFTVWKGGVTSRPATSEVTLLSSSTLPSTSSSPSPSPLHGEGKGSGRMLMFRTGESWGVDSFLQRKPYSHTMVASPDTHILSLSWEEAHALYGGDGVAGRKIQAKLQRAMTSHVSETSYCYRQSYLPAPCVGRSIWCYSVESLDLSMVTLVVVCAVVRLLFSCHCCFIV